jgi:hypothetical protein
MVTPFPLLVELSYKRDEAKVFGGAPFHVSLPTLCRHISPTKRTENIIFDMIIDMKTLLLLVR